MNGRSFWTAALPIILTVTAALGTAACSGEPLDSPNSDEEVGSGSAQLVVDPNAVYTLVGLQSGKCVEVPAGSTASGARLAIASCAGTAQQQFRAESMGNGYYRLRNLNSNLCVDVSGSSTADGGAVIQYACGSGLNQQWSFTDVTGGERLSARHSGKALDVTGKKTTDGALLEQWTWNGGSNQVFKLQPIVNVVKSAGCGKTRTLQNGAHTVLSSGTTRSYVLRAPDSYDSTRPYRLVLAYHWLTGTAQQVADGASSAGSPFYGLWNLGGANTIFIAPEGLSQGWTNNSGRDVTFTDDILAQVESDLCIDTSRVFATGFSFGASMTNALACARPNVFRGVALYSGAQLSGCAGGSAPVAYFATHGVNDAVISIATGRSLRDHYVSLDTCGPLSPEPVPSAGSHTCSTYQGCSAGHPVTWCAFSGDHTATPRDSGQTTSWVPQQAWNFISQF